MRKIPLLTLLFVLAATSAASALPATGFAVADGARYAAWPLDAHTTRIVDATTGETVDVPDPDGCGDVSATGGGLVAWSCPTTGSTTPHPVLMSVATGATFLPAKVDVLAAPNYGDCNWSAWSRIGSHWMQTRCDGYHGGNIVFWDWRTGASHYDAFGDVPDDRTPWAHPRQLRSLDTASGLRTLCAPARLSTRTGEAGFGGSLPEQTTQMDGGWVTGRSVDGEAIVAQRCGSKRRTVLCRSGCFSDPVLGGGWVSWTDASGIRAARLGRHGIVRRWSHVVPKNASFVRAGALVLLTLQNVTPNGVYSFAGVRILRLPGAPELPDGL